jgi:hypothetical protein
LPAPRNAECSGCHQVKIEPGDFQNKSKGVGGVEVVYTKYFDFVMTREASLKGFELEIEEMNYGMDIDGILGFDLYPVCRFGD